MSFFNFAFLDENNKVIDIFIFEEENPDINLLEDIKKQIQAHDFKSCSIYGTAFINGFFINDFFVKPKPFPSWVLNEETKEWESPIGQPLDNVHVFWDEENLTWQPFVNLE